MDVERALAFVTREGSAIETARLTAVMYGERPSEEVVAQISRFQRPDGGFAFWCPYLSNVCDTAYILQWLDDLGVHQCQPAAGACQFLLDRQKADGGWDEVEEVRRHQVPEWMMPGRAETRTWLTGFCSHMLIRFGYAEAPGTRCPTDFLLSHADARGRIEGYLRATWMALPMLAFYPGPNSQPFRKATAVVEEEYTDAWTGAYLAWLLRCLYDAHLPKGHPLVRRALDDLEGKQRQDGSWDPEPGEGEEHAVNATVWALRALRSFGRAQSE